MVEKKTRKTMPRPTKVKWEISAKPHKLTMMMLMFFRLKSSGKRAIKRDRMMVMIPISSNNELIIIGAGLASRGMAVTHCLNGNEGFDQACAGPFDAVVLDIMLPGRDGLSVLKGMRAAGVNTR